MPRPRRPYRMSAACGTGRATRLRGGRRREHTARHAAGWPVAIAALLSTVLAAACSDGAELDQGPPAPVPVPATTAAPSPTASATPGLGKPIVTLGPAAGQFTSHSAVVTFRAYQDAYSTALVEQDPNYQPLLDTTTGRMLDSAQQTIHELVDKGWVMHGATLWSLLAIQKESDTETVLEGCHWYSSSYMLDPATGKPAEELRDEWVAADIRLVRAGDRWQVESVEPASFPCTDAVRS